MLTQTVFSGQPGWLLQNDTLKAVVLPGHGGKIASLCTCDTGFELLFQNPHSSYGTARCGDAFSAYEACGFDDAFPCIDPETVQVGARAVDYPDHGEIWSAAFAAHKEGETLCLAFDSPLLGYRYQKQVSLQGQKLVCRYRIENPTEVPIPAIWACHCLLRYEPEMRIRLPAGVRQVQNVFDSEWLGEAGAVLNYPLPATGADLTRMPPHGQLKYYVAGPVEQGVCGVDYPEQGVCARFYYDSKKLPYLGFWATAGGYRGDVNCALEPASGYYDSISTARHFGRCPVLAPHTNIVFELALALGPITEKAAQNVV